MSTERKPINRGGIKSAGYDRNSRILEIEFSTGRTVQHSGVSEEISRRFFANSAPGSFYADNIEEEYPLKR